MEKLETLCAGGVKVTEAALGMLERTAENLTDSWDEDGPGPRLQNNPLDEMDTRGRLIDCGVHCIAI